MKKKTDSRKVFRKNSFTLIELVLVTSILAVTSLAVFSVFNSGMKIWKVTSKPIPEEELGFFFDKFTSDLRSCFKFESVSFIGKKDKIEFAVLSHSPRLQSRSVGRVTYSYDYQTGAVDREEADFSHIFSVDSGRAQRLIKNIKDFKILYYYFDDKIKEYLWKDEWTETEELLPLAVRAELLLDSGDNVERFVKTINILAGG